MSNPSPSDSTAVARREPAAEVAQLRTRAAPLGEIGFAEVLSLAKEIVPSGFLPDHIKTPAQAVAIILTGRELGMGPMRALRSLMMVKGKVVEAADSQLARFKTDGGRAVFEKLTDAEAVLKLRHPNGDEHTETFTLEDARRAKLLGNSNWQNYPKAMLRSRVITAALKSVGWEGGAGAYDPEEAIAFTPASNGASAAGAQPSQQTALDRALHYPLPGKPEAWGGFGGQPLYQCSLSLLHGVADWTRKKIDEDPAEPSDLLVELLAAVQLVLDARETGEVVEPESATAEATP